MDLRVIMRCVEFDVILYVIILVQCIVRREYDLCVLFFFKQKTAYEMRISDWSSDVCSSDLYVRAQRVLSSRTPQCPVPGSAFQQRREYDCGVPPCSVHVPLKPDPQRYCAQCRPWPLS